MSSKIASARAPLGECSRGSGAAAADLTLATALPLHLALLSEVYKGFSKITRQPVAIKIIDLENAEDEIDDIQQEIAILSQLDSEHVTK